MLCDIKKGLEQKKIANVNVPKENNVKGLAVLTFALLPSSYNGRNKNNF
jgi:hypothetical protein